MDDLASEQGIDAIDFLKLDAEGQEMAILEGGQTVFHEQSPVVLFEVLHGAGVNLGFWNALKPLGYEAFILCPSLNVLVSVDPDKLQAGSTLNLLACKPDRAACLEADGFMVRSAEVGEYDAPSIVEGAHKEYLRTLSYGREQEASGLFELSDSDEGSAAYLEGLDFYATAMAPSISVSDKFRLMCVAYNQIRSACTLNATFGRMLSLIRVAGELTEKSTAKILLTQLTDAIRTNEELSLAEPFLCPSPEFDDIDASGNMGRFIQASVVYQKIQSCGFSCYFRLKDAVEDIKLYEGQGIEHPKVNRIIQTIQGLSG